MVVVYGNFVCFGCFVFGIGYLFMLLWLLYFVTFGLCIGMMLVCLFSVFSFDVCFVIGWFDLGLCYTLLVLICLLF